MWSLVVPIIFLNTGHISRTRTYRCSGTTQPWSKVQFRDQGPGGPVPRLQFLDRCGGVSWGLTRFHVGLQPKLLCVCAYRKEFPQHLMLANESSFSSCTADGLVTTTHRFWCPKTLLKQMHVGELRNLVSRTSALLCARLLGDLKGIWHVPESHSSFLKLLGLTVTRHPCVWCS